MRKRVNRFLATLLVMLLALSPASNAASVLAAVPGEGQKSSGSAELEMTALDPASLHVKKLGETGGEALTPASEVDLNALVRVSIFLNESGAADAGYSLESIGTNSGARSYRSRIESQQKAMTSRIESALGYSLNVKWNLTLLTNAISCYVKVKDIPAVKAMDGVRSVERERQYEAMSGENADSPNTANTSSGMVGATDAWNDGYSGAGSRIAIIDTGIDTTHQSFAEDPFNKRIEELGKTSELMTQNEVSGLASQLNSKRGNYVSAKIPYGYNYVDENTTINHMSDKEGNHGSHVAGIAAANYYIKSGNNYQIAAETVHAVGMAPDAQLLIMKVFGSGGGAYDSDYMSAIEDAIVLGCDSVNLSLGSGDPGWTYDGTYQDILNKLASAENPNMVVTISAGNSGALTDAMPNDLYIEDVYMHTGGSPGTFLTSLGVAAAQNIGATGTPLVFNGNQTVYYAETESDNGAVMSSIAGSYSYVYIDAFGEASDYTTVNSSVSLNGKIVIVNRGNLSFYEKGNNAVSTKPKALIVANNQPGTINMDLSDYTGTFPMVSITLADAETIKANSQRGTAGSLTYYTGTVTVTDTTQSGATTTRDKAEVTEFSSWGVPGSLIMKPEITAPGGDIYSVNGTNDPPANSSAGGSDQYISYSGTSMAAPHMAGLSAIMGQYLRAKELEKLNAALTSEYSRRAVIQSLLMSTATPMKNGEEYYPILQQGAGLAEVYKAIKASSVIMVKDADLTTPTGSGADGKVKAEFGDDPDREGEYRYTFTIYNISDEDLNFDLRTEMFTQDRYEEDGYAYMSPETRSLNASVSYAWEAISGSAVTHDVNMDGLTNNNDVQAILDYLTGEKRKEDVDLEEADMDGDGEVTSKDAQLLIDWEGEEGTVGAHEVPAGAKRDVIVTIRLTDAQKAELDGDYPCGAYIEGFTYVTCDTASSEGESLAHEHSIPLLGFYGSWTDPSMFDNTSYTDRLYGFEKVPYGQNVNTNYLEVTYGGTKQKFSGNPYMVEEKFPEDRLAVNSSSKFGNIVYTLFRAAGTTGFAVSRLEEIGGEIESVLTSSVTGNEVTGIWYYVNQGTWQNLGSKTYNVNKSASAFGLKEGDQFRIGFYAIPEYNGMCLNKTDMTSEDAGILGSSGFREVLEGGALGKGAFMGFDFTVDDTAPEILSAALNGSALTLNAKDDRNLAYVAVMSLDGGTIYKEAAPGEAEYSETFDISDAIANANGYVAVFAGDYAGNETAVALQVNENVGGDETVYILTSDLKAGEDYLIVSRNSAGSGYALYFTLNASGTTATVAAKAVTVNAGNTDTDNKPFIEDIGIEATSIWTAGTGSTNGTFTLNSSGWYLRSSSNNNLTISKDASRRDWTWNSANSRLSISNRYLRYYNNTFSINTAVNSIYLYKKVEPVDPFAVSTVSLTPSSLDLYKNNEADLTAKVLPLTAENRKVTWTSSNNSIATVDENGHVTAIAAGSAVITATSAADPSISATASVKVTSVSKALNGIVWDEEGKVYFSSFNTSSLPTWNKLHNDSKDLELMSAFMADASTLYAGTLDMSAQETVLYTVNRNTYALTEYGNNYVMAFDAARTPSSFSSDYYVYAFAGYLIFGNIEPEEDEELGTFSGFPYGLLEAAETAMGDVYIAAVAARSISSTSGSYYLLDENGIIWQTNLSYSQTSGISFSTPTKIVDTGISTSFLYQSLYYDGTYLYWSHQTDEIAELIIINPSTKAVYHVGDFGQGIWPVGGLYVNGSAAPASAGEEPMGEGEELAGLKPIVTRDQLMTGEVMERLAAEAAKFGRKGEAASAVPAGSLNYISSRAPKRKVLRDEEPQPVKAGDAEDDTISVDYPAKAPVANGLVELDYDPEKITYLSTTSAADYHSVHVDTETGKITYAYASAAPIAAEEVIAEFVFEKPCEDAEVTITTMEAGDELAPEEPEETEIQGEGHSFGEPEWTWTGNDEDGYTAATAKFVCENDSDHVEILDAQISVRPGEEDDEGYTIYTASVTFEGETYTDTKKVKNAEPVHVHELEKTEAKAPTCEEAGNSAYWTCSVCGKFFSDAEGENEIEEGSWVIPALGHDYELTRWNWAEDHSAATAVFTCKNDPEHVENVEAAVQSKTTAAGCETSGKTVYTATAVFEGKTYTDTKETVIPAIGHEWGEATYTWAEDYSAVTAKMVCDHDASHVIEETAQTASEVTKQATCEEKGETTYTAVFTNDAFETQTKTVDNIPKLGHVWKFTEFEWTDSDTSGEPSASAWFTCEREPSHKEMVKAEISKESSDATCTEPGTVIYTATVSAEDSLDGELHTDKKTVSGTALGHDWGEITYTWSSDNKTVTAKRVCKRDESHVEEETVSASYKVNTEPGCETAGAGTWTSDAFKNEAFEVQTKTEEIPALGHDLVKTDAKAATCTENGNSAYWTCSRCGKFFSDEEGKNEITEGSWVIPATGHKYGEPTYSWKEDLSECTASMVCENDKTHVVTETVKTTSAVTKKPTCEEKGETTYTAAFANKAFTAQTKTVANIGALGHDWGEPVFNWNDTATEYVWVETTWEDITEEDVIAITMTKDDTTYILTSKGGTGSTPPPETITLEAEGKSFKTAVIEQFGWIREEREEGFALRANGEEGYLKTSNSNSQLRVGKINDGNYYIAKPNAEGDYLTLDTLAGAEKVRNLGVRIEKGEAKDWRTYDHIDANIADQTLQLWKLTVVETTKVTATRTCLRDETHTETVDCTVEEETKDPTCTEAGEIKTIATALFSDGTKATDEKTEEIPALGHDLVKTDAKAATCTENGNSAYWTCSRCGKFFSDAEGKNEIKEGSWIISATGHKYGEPAYSWKEDLSECTASMVCENDKSHVVTETVKTTSAVTKKATCEEKGETTYTAAFANKAFTAQTKTIANIDALGHDWGEAVFTWNGFEATATRTCKNDASHKQTVTAKVESKVTKEATATEDGERTYTAAATFADGKTYTDTKTEVIPATGETIEAWTWTRIAGSTRYATMAAITAEAYQGDAAGTLKKLIVASGENFPDALAGSALAGIYGCPIILTNKNKLTAQAKKEIQRLASADGCSVLILGGEGALTKEVENAIKAIGNNLTVERVAGANRAKTAIAVYQKGLSEANGFKNSDTVIITTGYNYADALSISPYAYASKTPVLLANDKGALTSDVKSLLSNAGFKKAVILGGNLAVSEETEAYLKEKGMTVLRLQGSTRYKTSAAIIKWSLGFNEKAAFQPSLKLTNEGMGVATGENFADALASVSLLGKTKSVLLLVNTDPKNATTKANVDALIKPYAKEMSKGYIFGGELAVKKEIEDLLNEAVK